MLRAARLPTGLLATRIDLRHAFYSVRLHPAARHVSSFALRTRRYQFTRLPMGLSLSPAFLQHVLEDVIRGPRKAAALSWVHVDDLLLVAEPHLIEGVTARVLEALSAAGFAVNTRKSQLAPVSHIAYLGLEISFIKRYFQP